MRGLSQHPFVERSLSFVAAFGLVAFGAGLAPDEVEAIEDPYVIGGASPVPVQEEIVDPGMFLAGKTIAGTILDLLTAPGELEKATAEFNERTGGGVGGSKWVAPLLPPDFKPPVKRYALAWPGR